MAESTAYGTLCRETGHVGERGESCPDTGIRDSLPARLKKCRTRPSFRVDLHLRPCECGID